jgi:hypothetical protein
VTDPGRSFRARPGRTPRWAVVGFPLAFIALVGLVVAVHAVVHQPRVITQPSAPLPSGSPVPSSALAGEWSGNGALTDCAGFDDEHCRGTRSITLTIACSGNACRVTPFDDSYGRPPLRFEDGRYRATGPVPAEVAPTCGGSPTHSAFWRLEVAVRDGRMRGSYSESTIQSFNCGATWLQWEVTLERK